jgi:hypothetical protein
MTSKGCLAYGEIESWYNSASAEIFRGCSSITKITNCKLVATGQEGSIGNYAFNGCTNSKEVVFGTSTVTTLSTIGTNAFYSCTSLTKIDLGNVVEILNAIAINVTAFVIWC